jgi:hypothetical protein
LALTLWQFLAKYFFRWPRRRKKFREPTKKSFPSCFYPTSFVSH